MSEEPEPGSAETTEQPEKPYTTEQFSFVEDPLEESPDASGWLNFMNSRAGRRVDRRERARERLWVLGVALGLVLAVVGVVLWSPWSSGPAVDDGHAAMPGDRVAVLLQVQGTDSTATSSAILLHDRRGGGRSALVMVPGDLVVPVEGEGRLTMSSALAQSGPTLSREALSELLGVPIAGSWVLDSSEFALLVDRLGGLTLSGRSLTGAQALTQAADPNVVRAFLGAFPTAYTAGRDLLRDFGILAAPGLPVDLLGAVVTGLSRDSAAGRLTTASLLVDPVGHGLDATTALPVVRDVLGGKPGSGDPDATPRILVQLATGNGISESDVRADVLNAGYDYVDGGAAPKGAASVVLVRPTTPDAQALGASIATTLGLPASAVKLSDDVPFTADVLVVLGADRKSVPDG